MDKLKGFIYSKHFAVGTKSEKEIFLLQTKKRGDFIIEYPLDKISNYIRKIVEIEGKIQQVNLNDHGAVSPVFSISVSNIYILDNGIIPD